MKPSMLGLLIAACAFAASTIYLSVQLHEERERAGEVLARTQALNQRIAELERARSLMADVRGGSGAAPTSPPPGDPTATPAEAQEEAADSRRFAPPPRSEAMQKMFRTQLRANLRRLQSDIGAKLGLTRDQTNQLLDLLAEQQIALMEQGGPRVASRNPEEWAALQEKNLAEVAALIGADKVQAYQDYQKTLPARQEVEMLSRQLEANDVALSGEQRDRLVAALAEERQRVPAPQREDSATPEAYRTAYAQWEEDYNQRAAARAGSILSSDQQSAYSDYQQWTRDMRQQFEARRAARPPGSGGFPPPPPP